MSSPPDKLLAIIGEKMKFSTRPGFDGGQKVAGSNPVGPTAVRRMPLTTCGVVRGSQKCYPLFNPPFQFFYKERKGGFESKRQLVLRHNQQKGPAMPRAAKLGRHKGYWYTKTGSRAGVYFGRVREVPFSEANKAFRKYLSTLGNQRRASVLSAKSVAEICDLHLRWISQERSPALLR
jgi:hypothetical protein